ncbi:TonB-dependent receptor plug domain-containing protein [Flavobacterium sp. Fl-318]|jgi:outer membrane receptor protein involved in Fe transport|uniref:TonB-dependent receptor plug domain-containing protein n=1 Tax=Flavobacterium cupriresistens TaxID=2893885 RepID=A0ABU4RCH1_9FLAO|nr:MULTISPECIES: TonB-dependent receptor plug domain-containing protein [unclassified Flavobacterium]MDX6189693.1 TonB-dependent receptor plug domain-containing protein [Flavobacterium sp. Fl-318]UFH40901.1 TonB-dependent receptor plug domain-containing protein [Flavobacterium sp. F-323]
MISESVGLNKIIVFLFLFTFSIKRADAQVTMNIISEFKEPIIGATVTVRGKDSFYFQKTTDVKGQVIISGRPGSYSVFVESVSFKKNNFKMQINAEQSTLDIILMKSIQELDEVVVEKTKLTAAQKIRESLYAPEVIDFKDFKSTSKSVVEAINLASGLRIQQQGGMGSALNININGIDGKDVRVFVDEIPVYLLGRGFELQNLTTNMIDRVEIYKGLVPIQFGSDALGGVINIVTRKSDANFLGTGYSYGSWNTHEATLSAYTHPLKNKKFFAGIDAVYRHSDNDYWMDDVEVVADDLYNTKKGRARRFNDKYDFGLAKVQIGFKDLSWADNLKFISSFTYTNKEWQHGITALKPWGEPFSNEYTGGAALNWKKSSSQKNSWQIDVTAGYNFEQNYFEDISSRIYFWDGNYIEGQNKGESGLYSQGITPKIIQKVWYARENAFFRIAENYRINVNLFTTKRELTGEDKAGAATYKDDPFKEPQTLLNNFFGTSLESKFLNGRLLSTTSLKHYYSKVRGVSFKITNEFDKISTSTSSDIGFGQVFKWVLSPKIAIIPGYEYTVRQPDSREIFGDYITVSPNPNLKSATSHNVNLKIQFKALNEKLFTGIGGFYRNTKNRIILTSFSNSLAAYTNLLQTTTIGGEWYLQYKPTNTIDLSINTTYQDIRLAAVDDLGIFTDKYIGARIPNTPYLFSNFQGSYTFNPGNNRNYYFRFLYTSSYVHEYFLTWAINGKKSSKVTIPSQLINDVSISIHSKNNRWSFAIDCKNLTDARLYDNFSVQKPGRSFYGKITYILTKQ